MLVHNFGKLSFGLLLSANLVVAIHWVLQTISKAKIYLHTNVRHNITLLHVWVKLCYRHTNLQGVFALTGVPCYYDQLNYDNPCLSRTIKCSVV